MKRRLITAGLVIAFCLGVVVTRAIWEGRGALADGDAAAEAGDREGAIRWWRRAARWYVPLAPHVDGAYDRLEKLGAVAEEEGDLPTALLAWQGVRGSVLATRSFYTPHEERLDPANRHIASLMQRLEGAAADPGKSAAEREAWHHDLLARDEAPSVGWTVVALLGFAIWIGGGVLFALRGVSPEDRLVARIATSAGVLVLAGLFVWLLGLYNA